MKTVHVANIYKRGIAKDVDSLLVIVVCSVVVYFACYLFGFKTSQVPFLTSIMSTALIMVYDFICLKNWSATLGKRLFNLKVEGVNGKLTTLMIFKRVSFDYLPSFVFSFLSIKW